jgi:hypothetical protein
VPVAQIYHYEEVPASAEVSEQDPQDSQVNTSLSTKGHRQRHCQRGRKANKEDKKKTRTGNAEPLEGAPPTTSLRASKKPSQRSIAVDEEPGSRRSCLKQPNSRSSSRRKLGGDSLSSRETTSTSGATSTSKGSPTPRRHLPRQTSARSGSSRSLVDASSSSRDTSTTSSLSSRRSHPARRPLRNRPPETSPRRGRRPGVGRTCSDSESQGSLTVANRQTVTPPRRGRRPGVGRSRSESESLAYLTVASQSAQQLQQDLKELEQELKQKDVKPANDQVLPQATANKFGFMRTLSPENKFGFGRSLTADGLKSAATSGFNLATSVAKTAAGATVQGATAAANVGLATSQVAAGATLFVAGAAVGATVGLGQMAVMAGVKGGASVMRSTQPVASTATSSNPTSTTAKSQVNIGGPLIVASSNTTPAGSQSKIVRLERTNSGVHKPQRAPRRCQRIAQSA